MRRIQWRKRHPQNQNLIDASFVFGLNHFPTIQTANNSRFWVIQLNSFNIFASFSFHSFSIFIFRFSISAFCHCYNYYASLPLLCRLRIDWNDWGWPLFSSAILFHVLVITLTRARLLQLRFNRRPSERELAFRRQRQCRFVCFAAIFMSDVKVTKETY